MPYGYTQPSNWKAIKRQVFARDGHTCYVCKQDGAEQVDAIVPESQGGSHTDLDNLAPIHAEPCHRLKSEAERRAGHTNRRARINTKRKAEAHPGSLRQTPATT